MIHGAKLSITTSLSSHGSKVLHVHMLLGNLGQLVWIERLQQAREERQLTMGAHHGFDFTSQF